MSEDEVRLYRVQGGVSAIKWTGANVAAFEDLLGPVSHFISRANEVVIRKNGKSLRVPIDDWVLRLGDGEYATCTDEEFHEIYELEWERTTYDDKTLNRVLEALVRSGVSYEGAENCVREMQNFGILFRERVKD